MMRKISLTFLLAYCSYTNLLFAQQNEIAIIAYYAGNAENIDAYPVEKLTHIIYSFCHLKGNRLAVDNANDSLTIRHLVGLKARNPKLKVMLALGGWGGCKPCSAVFASKKGRRDFAESAKEIMETYHVDGLDLDWEYPAIEGHPGHPWSLNDRRIFTLLIKQLRKKMGWDYEISFAAGGFTKFLEASVEWHKIMPLLDRVNLMSYDLVHGYSTVTGHHTPLYSNPSQVESTDHAVHFLDSIGVPLKKVAIGAAFYGRVWENVAAVNEGIYQSGKFKRGVSYKLLPKYLEENPGYQSYWDDVSKAPYMYNSKAQLYFTYDNERSVALKTKYAMEKGLNGIMFWQLGEDAITPEKGLLEVIFETGR